jgi:hypothetical protein
MQLCNVLQKKMLPLLRDYYEKISRIAVAPL